MKLIFGPLLLLSSFTRADAQDISEKDIAYGRNLDQQVSRAYATAQPPDVARRVFARLAETEIAKKSPVKGFSLSFIRTQTVNAFSTAGGHLYVTDGLLGTVGDHEGELAFAMGHEMGHLILRHRMKRNIRAVAERIAYSQIRSPRVRLAFLAGRKIAEGKIRRDEENAADRLGLLLTAEAGYHPDSALTLIENLSRANHERSKTETFLFGDHPRWDTRAGQVHAHYDEALSLYNRVLPRGLDIETLTVPEVETRARTIIAIESEPGEALISIDAKPQGRTPASVELEPGRHFIMIRLDRFEMWTGEVVLKPGESASMNAHLRPVEESPNVIVVRPTLRQ